MAIADKLLYQKQNFGIKSVQQQLGAGSNTTLLEYLNAWCAQCMPDIVKEVSKKHCHRWNIDSA